MLFAELTAFAFIEFATEALFHQVVQTIAERNELLTLHQVADLAHEFRTHETCQVSP